MRPSAHWPTPTLTEARCCLGWRYASNIYLHDKCTDDACQALIDENHAHLITLGVSHPVLEQIKDITGKSEFGLHTKLTGAGGGGCAVTLIPDGGFSCESPQY